MWKCRSEHVVLYIMFIWLISLFSLLSELGFYLLYRMLQRMYLIAIIVTSRLLFFSRGYI